MMFIVGIISLLLPGYFLSHALSDQVENRLKNTLLISLSAVPLILLYLNMFLSLSLDKSLISIVVLLINLLAYLYWRKNKVVTNSIKDYFPYILAIISASIFYYFFFILHPISLSGDIANLIYDVGYIIKNGQIRQIFDRSFIFIFPTIIHYLTGASAEAAMKIYILANYILLSQATYLISKKIFKNKFISFLTTLLVLLSEAFINYIVFIIPFTLGIIMLFSIIEIFMNDSKKTSKKLILFAYFLWAIIFNIHGVIAFGSVLIVPAVILFNQKSKIFKNKKTHLMGIIIFLLLSQPLLFNHSSKILYGLIKPITNKITSHQIIQAPSNSLQTVGVSKWTEDWSSTSKVNIKELPIYGKDFIRKYSLPIVLLAIYGLWMLLQRKDSSKNALIITTIFLFLFTQQKIFGVNWFSFRFVYSLSISMFVLAIYGTKTLLEKLAIFGLNLNKHSLILFTVLLGIIPIKNSFTFLDKVAPVISQAEYDLYHDVGKYVGDETIFVVSSHSKWIAGINPLKNYYLVKFKTMCASPEEELVFPPQIWNISRALSDSSTLENSIKTLSGYANYKEYFIVLNANTVNCINPDLFPVSHYEFIIDGDQSGIYLLKSK